MLVLSRRPSEKILFPNLGISVEIIQTKGNTVRVGIEAPPEIRVLRDELVQDNLGNRDNFDLSQHVSPAVPPSLSATAKPNYPVSLSSSSDLSQFEQRQKEQLCEQIDDIGLAIALAQNQQRQGLADNVDIALEQAIERLQVLKELLNSESSQSAVELVEQTAVCEDRPDYQRNSSRSPDTILQLATSRSQSTGIPFRLSFELTNL